MINSMTGFGRFEVQRAGAGDGAQVVLQLILGHAAAVVGDRQES